MSRVTKEIGSRPWDKLEEEPDLAWECFIIFKDAGYDRSVSLVLATMEDKDVTEKDIDEYREKYNWQKRIRAWDSYLEEKIEKQVIRNNLRRRIKTEFALSWYVNEFAARLASGKMKNISFDFDTFIKVVKAASETDKLNIDELLKTSGYDPKQEEDAAILEIKDRAEELSNMTPEQLKLASAEELKQRLEKKYKGRTGIVVLTKPLDKTDSGNLEENENSKNGTDNTKE